LYLYEATFLLVSCLLRNTMTFCTSSWVQWSKTMAKKFLFRLLKI
jgi:hypothetical protein